MNLSRIIPLLMVSSFLFSSMFSQASELESNFSGYARIVGGVLNDEDAKYFGYSDSLEFEQNSLLGVQGQLKFNEQLSFTGLGLFHSNSNRDSGLEWGYLSYRPTNALNIKVGQMQTPFYSLSDTLDVGYSYPWVIAPREVYNDFAFNKFQGIDLRYSFLTNDYSAHVESYYGKFDGKVSVNNTEVDTKVNDLAGLIGELRIENFNTRMSYHTGNVTPLRPDLMGLAQALSLAGFFDSAATLDVENKRAHFLQLSFNYESLDYLIKAEWIKINTDPVIFPTISGYYLTYGHYFGDITALITYGKRNDDISTMSNPIPQGILPQLDQLSFGYQAVIDSQVENDTDSLTLGIRWDFTDNMALKGEYKFIESAEGNIESFEVVNPASFDYQADLLVIALEWVF